jgi:methyltransferase-like protein
MDDEMARFVLLHLDGTHNRESLQTLMLEAVRNGQVTIPKANQENQALTRDLISDQLEAILAHLCRCGVMVA